MPAAMLSPDLATRCPPRELAEDEDTPLGQWLNDLGAWYLGLGTERGLLIASTLFEMSSDAWICQTPGRRLSVEDYLDRRQHIPGRERDNG